MATAEVEHFPTAVVDNLEQDSEMADISGAVQPVNGAQDTNGSQVVEAEQPEHPDADAIRRQVEYYFSDENLPNDMHMLQCTGGRLNLPVNVNRICGFKRMRAFKPKRIVVQALRNSTFLELTDNDKKIRRRVPLMIPTIIDADDDEDDADIAYDPRSAPPVQEVKLKAKIPLLSQVKKQIPPGLTKGMLKPTGFEDSYVEGPITPAQAEEEIRLYDPEKPFVERIEIAIQRFKQKRRMHEMYAKVFNKWMRFGGVECGPRMFGGKPSQQEMKEMDAEDIVKALATHHVPWDREEEDEWVVDFEGLAKGFLSSFYPANFGHGQKQIKTACQVLRSFYNYILLHSVCPEHEADVLRARKVCNLADIELPSASEAALALPGKFNIAASTLFGGYHANLYAGNASWADSAENLSGGWGDDTSTIGMKTEEATIIFKTGVAVYGSDELFGRIEREGVKGIKALKTEFVGLNVERIQRPDQVTLEIFKKQNQNWKHKLALSALGKLYCTPWVAPTFETWDLPANHPGPAQPASKSYEFWIEDEVLDLCFPGMKMEAQVTHFDAGITVLDSVSEVHPSFYEFLPNELWMTHKPKEVRFLKRGAEAEEELIREREAATEEAQGKIEDAGESDEEIDD